MKMDKNLTIRCSNHKYIVTGKENRMNLNDLNRLTNSPAFRGGPEKFVEKVGKEIQKNPNAIPKLLEAIGKTVQKIIR